MKWTLLVAIFIYGVILTCETCAVKRGGHPYGVMPEVALAIAVAATMVLHKVLEGL